MSDARMGCLLLAIGLLWSPGGRAEPVYPTAGGYVAGTVPMACQAPDTDPARGSWVACGSHGTPPGNGVDSPEVTPPGGSGVRGWLSGIFGRLTTIAALMGGNFGVIQAGGAPLDASANAAPVPITGYTLLQTLPAAPGRANLECQNQSTSIAQLVLDDGAGGAGGVSSVMIAAAAAAGGQGGSWNDPSFKGRLRAYGPSATQRVMCRQD